LVTNIRYQFRV